MVTAPPPSSRRRRGTLHPTGRRRPPSPACPSSLHPTGDARLLVCVLWICRQASPVVVAAGLPPPGGCGDFLISQMARGPFKELPSGGVAKSR